MTAAVNCPSSLAKGERQPGPEAGTTQLPLFTPEEIVAGILREPTSWP